EDLGHAVDVTGHVAEAGVPAERIELPRADVLLLDAARSEVGRIQIGDRRDVVDGEVVSNRALVAELVRRAERNGRVDDAQVVAAGRIGTVREPARIEQDAVDAQPVGFQLDVEQRGTGVVANDGDHRRIEHARRIFDHRRDTGDVADDLAGRRRGQRDGRTFFVYDEHDVQIDALVVSVRGPHREQLFVDQPRQDHGRHRIAQVDHPAKQVIGGIADGAELNRVVGDGRVRTVERFEASRVGEDLDDQQALVGMKRQRRPDGEQGPRVDLEVDVALALRAAGADRLHRQRVVARRAVTEADAAAEYVTALGRQLRRVHLRRVARRRHRGFDAGGVDDVVTLIDARVDADVDQRAGERDQAGHRLLDLDDHHAARRRRDDRARGSGDDDAAAPGAAGQPGVRVRRLRAGERADGQRKRPNRVRSRRALLAAYLRGGF